MTGRPPWDFGYRPVPTSGGDDDGEGSELLVATSSRIDPARVEAAVAPLAPGICAREVLARAPIFWTLVRADAPLRRDDVTVRLRKAGLPLRYVASARRPDLRVYPVPVRGAPGARPHRSWRRRDRTDAPDPPTPGRWFLGDDGIGVLRGRLGSGAGTRLAVIDSDAMEADRLGLDAEVLVHIDAPPRAQAHGSLMVAWAVGAARGQGDVPFRGVAPDASPRIYAIPKPEVDVFSLPAAIVRAVSDGADVVVSAAYLEGSTSPMLDDALEFAARLGRGGRGAPVVLPTGREASSPAGSVHSSWSLGFGEPASDPRVFCIGPSGRDGGWFLWPDRKGKLRPFANRGPAIRWLAPGDDISYPFAAPERLFHAESSGASAIAAGALLLVIAANPTLRVDEIEAIVSSTIASIADTAAAETGARGASDRPPLADPHDLLPTGADADGHNAKAGYGRIHAGRACLAASDPIAWALVRIGESDAAARLSAAVARGDLSLPYSPPLGRWMVRALLRDHTASHAWRSLARHLRLVAEQRERQHAHGAGALVRQIEIAFRSITARRRVPERLAAELAHLQRALADLARAPLGERETVESGMQRMAAAAFASTSFTDAAAATTLARSAGRANLQPVPT